MKPPCEIVVWYLIPGIRSILAKELFKSGMKQKDISKVLDITQPAVSQYISDKRGNEIGFNDEILEMIKKLADDLKNEKITKIEIISRICEICRKTKVDDILCILHKEKDMIPESCRACLTDETPSCGGELNKKGFIAKDVCKACSEDPSEYVLFYDI